MLILYNLMKQSSSIYPGSCWATPSLRQVEGRRPREPSSCLQWKSCSQSPQDLNHDQVAWRCPLELCLQSQIRKPTQWSDRLQVATRHTESGSYCLLEFHGICPVLQVTMHRRLRQESKEVMGPRWEMLALLEEMAMFGHTPCGGCEPCWKFSLADAYLWTLHPMQPCSADICGPRLLP